eukprot:3700508-Prymnesium_polylepis.1
MQSSTDGWREIRNAAEGSKADFAVIHISNHEAVFAGDLDTRAARGRSLPAYANGTLMQASDWEDGYQRHLP